MFVWNSTKDSLHKELRTRISWKDSYNCLYLWKKNTPYRKRRTEAIATCPEFEGARDSPVFKRGQAWSREKNSPSSPETYSIPRTPDSGLAPSLKDSKCSEPCPSTDQATRSCTPSSLQSSSKGSSSSNGENDDVFDEKATEAETSSTRCVLSPLWFLTCKFKSNILPVFLFIMIKLL